MLSAIRPAANMKDHDDGGEKRRGMWTVLGAAKTEFEKYGHVWDKLGKQLDTARRTVEEAGKRTRAVSRKLRDVEALDQPIHRR